MVWYVNISHHYHNAAVLTLARMKNNYEELLTAAGQVTGRAAKPPLSPGRPQASVVSGYSFPDTEEAPLPERHHILFSSPSTQGLPLLSHCFWCARALWASLFSSLFGLPRSTQLSVQITLS